MLPVKLLLPLLLISAASVGQLVKPESLTDATLPGDFADPSIIQVKGTYYAAGTSSEWAPFFPIYTSTNLIEWKQLGFVFKQLPEWAAASFWAPELYYHNNKYYVYYVARRKKDNVSCIGLATSDDPAKGFTDHGVLLEFGKEAIDPYIYNDKGQLYMSFKAYGLDKRPIEILCVKLSADGMKVTGEPVSLFRDDKRIGLEGQAMIKEGQYYYLFYSAGNCCGVNCSYNVRVARATKLTGPYTDYPSNPILSESGNWKCMGHGTILPLATGGYYYLHHGYNKYDSVFTGRQGLASAIKFDPKTGWPEGKTLYRSVSTSKWNVADSFDGSVLSNVWSYDYRHGQVSYKVEGGALALTGDGDSTNHTGAVLAVRPINGSYDISTIVTNTNASLKGLVLYGDANQSVGIGIAGDQVQIWEVRNNKRKVLAQQAVTAAKVQLKLSVGSGYWCRFYYALGDGEFTELPIANREFYDGKHLPPWDRAPRPGLVHYGDWKYPAQFSEFKLTY